MALQNLVQICEAKVAHWRTGPNPRQNKVFLGLALSSYVLLIFIWWSKELWRKCCQDSIQGFGYLPALSPFSTSHTKVTERTRQGDVHS